MEKKPAPSHSSEAMDKILDSITPEEQAATDERMMNEAFDGAIGNLLAVLHRDGGHYQARNGRLKAVLDAQKLLHKKWVTIDFLESELNTLREENERLKLLCGRFNGT